MHMPPRRIARYRNDQGAEIDMRWYDGDLTEWVDLLGVSWRRTALTERAYADRRDARDELNRLEKAK